MIEPFVHEALPVRIRFGHGTVKEISAEIQRLGAHRALVLHLDGLSARLLGDMAGEEDQISNDNCVAPAFRHANSFNHRVSSIYSVFGRFSGVGSSALIASMTHIATPA